MPHSSTPPLDRTTMLILCCIGFVGVPGVHRFASGHVLLGVVYLLTGGLCLIGTIVDLIAISNGTYRDMQGRSLPLG